MKSIYKTFFKKVLIVCVFCFASALTSNAEKIEDLKVNKYINDFANIIEDNTELELENNLREFFASTTHQIVVVTVNNIDGDYIENYSIKLAEKIKAGGEKNDNGAILLISKDDKQMRLEVGYGLEGVLTDSRSSYITNNIIKPEFKNGNYTAGIKNGVEEVVKVTSQENYGKGIDEKSKNSPNILLKILSKFPPEVFLIIFFLGFGAIQWFISVLGRTKSWWLGGIIGFIISAILFYLVIQSLFIFLITLFGFLFDYFISKNYKEHSQRLKDGPPDWWAGGSAFGGGSGWSGSSSGGGFSGGGGGFGGGGSSSSW